jgi:hypothetical protein
MNMKKNMQNWLIALLFVAGAGGVTLTVALPQTTFACSDHLLTFPAWYRGIQKPDPDCSIVSPTGSKAGLTGFIWTIVLNVIESALQLVGYIAVGFIIVGGFKYMTSAGSPDGMVRARKTIMNAVIGLVISIFSVAIINLVSGAIN